MNGYFGKYLDIDLSTNRIITINLDEELARKYIGGSGLGAKFSLALAYATSNRGACHLSFTQDYEFRGWDENGLVSEEKISELGLSR
jgi:aldehyde:ferredoxin oxidoreductase